MKELAGLMGWIAAWGFCFEVMSYFIKLINRKYICKLSQEKNKIIHFYHFAMKLIIKYHKSVGIITVIAAVAHTILMAQFFELSMSGIIAVGLMLFILITGLYGAYINKSRKGKWLKFHRALSIVLIIVIIIHIAG
ncbi:MAG: hypothetical protein AB9836_08180 [Aminipila sp.]